MSNKFMKINKVFILILMLIFFLSSFVSAYGMPSFRQMSEQTIQFYVDVFEPVLGALFGGFGWSGLYLFERLLLFILLVGFIYVVIGKFKAFKEVKAVRWIISIIVPLIGIRYINYESLTTIIYQYTWLTVAVTCALPIIVFFFFVHTIAPQSPALRKVLWVFFLLIYLGLWSTVEASKDSTLYSWTIVAIILLIIFDNRFQRYFEIKKAKEGEFYWKGDLIAKLDHDIELINASSFPLEQKEKLIAAKQKEKKWLLKQSAY
jgi:hypothetical protein